MIPNVPVLRLHRFSACAIVVCAVVACIGAHRAHALTPVSGVFTVDGVRIRSFPSIAAGSSVAVVDLDNDGQQEIVVGSPPGVRAQITEYALDGTVMQRIYPYGSGMKAGITVAVGDFAGNGYPQIAVAPRKGAGPQVLLYSIDGRKLNTGLWVYGKKFNGGVNLAAGDVDGDGIDELITGAGPGGGPHLAAYHASGPAVWGMFPYELSYRAGITVATFDVDGNGTDEVLATPLSGRVSDVTISNLPSKTVQSTFRALNNFKGGSSVTGLRVNGAARIAVGAGQGGGPDIQQYDLTGASAARHFFAFDPSWRGGVTVATIDAWHNGQQELLVIPGAPSLTVAQLSSFEQRYSEPAINGVTLATDRVQAASGFFTVKQIRINLDTPGLRVQTVTATDGDCDTGCPVHPLQYFIDQAGGIAGVNGGYFCPASDRSCAAKTGSYFWLWYNSLSGTFVNLPQNAFNVDPVLAFGGQNMPVWYPVSKDFHTKEEFEATNGMPLTALLSNTPMLVSGGKSVVRQSTLDTSQRATASTRVGIGLQGRTLVIFVVYRASVLNLAHVAVALGLDSALNLDGGSSTALTYGNRYQAGPGRNVPMAVVISAQ